MRLPSCCRKSCFWFAAFLLWAGALWLLSDGPIPGPDLPSFSGHDKVLHFAYFFGGAGLLSAALFLARSRPPNWTILTVVVVTIVAGIGILDEWHQSWIPGRTGNDLGDWLADLTGALAGSLVFRRLHHLLHQPPSHQ